LIAAVAALSAAPASIASPSCERTALSGQTRRSGVLVAVGTIDFRSGVTATWNQIRGEICGT
jgi:hypothetical protein